MCLLIPIMGMKGDLNIFDKDQIIIDRRLHQSISVIAWLVEWSYSVVLSTYQKWLVEGEIINLQKDTGCLKLIDMRSE